MEEKEKQELLEFLDELKVLSTCSVHLKCYKNFLILIELQLSRFGKSGQKENLMMLNCYFTSLYFTIYLVSKVTN